MRAPTASAAVPAPTYRPGCDDDFERLYRDSYARLLYTLLAILDDYAAAEDCVQEAAARAFRAWSGWKPEAPAEAWLHRIALNVAFSYRRRERLREVGEIIRRFGGPRAEPDPADVGEATQLFAALRRLPAPQSALILLRHHHGYTNREIAFALGVPETTIGSRLAAAKRRLAAELDAPARVVTRDGSRVINA
jgi:RNA polymerase sigma-70 factor (ECF subfamily)